MMLAYSFLPNSLKFVILFSLHVLCKAVGLYLIPWARVCDLIAALLTTRCQWLRAYRWYVAAVGLSLIVAAHVLGFVALLSKFASGSEGPCVCTTAMSDASHEHPVCLSFVVDSPVRNVVSMSCAVFFVCLGILRLWTWLLLCAIAHYWIALSVIIICVLAF
jgi:hypothetical protein